MRPVVAAGVQLELESPEAARYRAPILLLPGLFQSSVCWRGMTSMLAHRGWEVYVLSRNRENCGWEQTLDQAARAAAALAERVVLFGADIGAALALAASCRCDPLALVLFAPASPSELGRRYRHSLGFFARRRGIAEAATSAPKRIAKDRRQAADLAGEPPALLADLVAGVDFAVPAEHPPAIVFRADSDPLVSRQACQEFLLGPRAKASASVVNGRWWPSLEWEGPCDEAHRFLVLTLGDRVVEFPEEILGA